MKHFSVVGPSHVIETFVELSSINSSYKSTSMINRVVQRDLHHGIKTALFNFDFNFKIGIRKDFLLQVAKNMSNSRSYHAGFVLMRRKWQ